MVSRMPHETRNTRWSHKTHVCLEKKNFPWNGRVRSYSLCKVATLPQWLLRWCSCHHARLVTGETPVIFRLGATCSSFHTRCVSKVKLHSCVLSVICICSMTFLVSKIYLVIWSQVRERNKKVTQVTISEAVLGLKLFYPVGNVCSLKCSNFFADAKTYTTFLP